MRSLQRSKLEVARRWRPRERRRRGRRVIGVGGASDSPDIPYPFLKAATICLP